MNPEHTGDRVVRHARVPLLLPMTPLPGFAVSPHTELGGVSGSELAGAVLCLQGASGVTWSSPLPVRRTGIRTDHWQTSWTQNTFTGFASSG